VPEVSGRSTFEFEGAHAFRGPRKVGRPWHGHGQFGFTVPFFASRMNTAMAVGVEVGEEKWLFWLLPLASSFISHSVSLRRRTAASDELDILEHS
jgi:hypothetical protein